MSIFMYKIFTFNKFIAVCFSTDSTVLLFQLRYKIEKSFVRSFHFYRAMLYKFEETFLFILYKYEAHCFWIVFLICWETLVFVSSFHKWCVKYFSWSSCWWASFSATAHLFMINYSVYTYFKPDHNIIFWSIVVENTWQ